MKRGAVPTSVKLAVGAALFYLLLSRIAFRGDLH